MRDRAALWLATRPWRSRVLHALGEGMREAGVLFMVFAPLDTVLGQEGSDHNTALWLFFGIGATLFAVGLYVEAIREP